MSSCLHVILSSAVCVLSSCDPQLMDIADPCRPRYFMRAHVRHASTCEFVRSEGVAGCEPGRSEGWENEESHNVGVVP